MRERNPGSRSWAIVVVGGKLDAICTTCAFQDLDPGISSSVFVLCKRCYSELDADCNLEIENTVRGDIFCILPCVRSFASILIRTGRAKQRSPVRVSCF
jgi:hypothetical protein